MSDKLDKAIKRFTNVTVGILDNGLQTIEAINAGLGIIADAEKQARAEMRAAEFTNCKRCQSALVLFIKDTPHADTPTIQVITENLWENCPDCIAEYAEVLANTPCKHGIRSWENCEACLDELDAWADANEPEILDAPSDWERQNIEVAK